MSDRLLPPEPSYCPACGEEMVKDTVSLELTCPACIVGTPCPVTDLAGDHIHAPHILTWDAAAQAARCPMCIVEWLGCTMAIDFDEYPGQREERAA